MPPSPAPPTDTEAARLALRAQMPVAEKWAYFDHAAVAPLCRPGADAIARWSQQALAEGDTVWLEWDRIVEQTREAAARLINARADEIALVPNTTAGINLVAEGLDWRDGDNVVILADEFPSNLYPWMNLGSRGVETRRLATDVGCLDLDLLRDACDSRTRVVSVSWVGYCTGYRQDLGAIADIAHACGANGGRGAWFFLDAIQGLGVYPLDVRNTPIDFLAADGHKWLLGPEGAGVAYFRRERLEELRPMGVGWKSVVGANDFDKHDLELKPTAARYEGGSANMPGMHALGASFDLLMSWPVELTTAAVLEITDYLCERLSAAGISVASHRAAEPNGHDPRSAIVVADPPDPDAARRRCYAKGVAVSVRGGRLRLSPHAYTTRGDVDRLIDALVV